MKAIPTFPVLRRLPRFLGLAALASLLFASAILRAAQPSASAWRVGTPIVTYWAGPAMTDATATQMAEGGFNVVWCAEKELDVAHRHGLRAQLQDGLLTPASLENPEQRQKLDALIERVRNHPALYCYFITDEPSAGQFPALGKLVAYLRERDPAHMAYINLFPTYANNEQLGTKGAVVPAYREHLRQYMDVVKPSLVSYDHYQYKLKGDGTEYFLNLAMIRDTALQAKVPFLNIVQACTWNTNAMRVPNADEVRYLVYTTLAYGAQGVSYYVYSCVGHVGAIASLDGTPTSLYHALKSYNREFVAICKELQPLAPLGVYHTSMTEAGCEPLPAGAVFRPGSGSGGGSDSPRGLALGYFGKSKKVTHAVVVNLDYTRGRKVSIEGNGKLSVLDAGTGVWNRIGKKVVELDLPPGGGALIRTGNK